MNENAQNALLKSLSRLLRLLVLLSENESDPADDPFAMRAVEMGPCGKSR